MQNSAVAISYLAYFRKAGGLVASYAICLTYQTLYILALGATNAQIGLMSALSNLSAALVLMPGAILSDRFRRSRPLVC